MAEVDVGVVTPAAPVPGADLPVPAPDAPAGQDQVTPPEGEPVKSPPKTYTEEENRRLVSERLTKERRRLERIVRAEMERDFYKQQVEAASKPKDTPPPKGEPQPQDYEDPKEFVRAFMRYERAQEREAEKRESATQQEQVTSQRQAQSLVEAVKKGSKEFEDFDEVVFGDAGEGTITRPMAHAIAECKAPAKIAYYLRTHADEAERIADLPSTLQAHEIHLLVAKVAAPPNPTKAPAPIVPAGGNAGVRKDYTDMDTKEHVESWLKRPKR